MKANDSQMFTRPEGNFGVNLIFNLSIAFTS